MNVVAVSETLELTLPPGAAHVRLTPGEAFDLAEELVRRGIRRAMTEEVNAVDGLEEDDPR